MNIKLKKYFIACQLLKFYQQPSSKEALAALLTGKTIKYKDKEIYYKYENKFIYCNKFNSGFKLSDVDFNSFIAISNKGTFIEYDPEVWFENIPEKGVWCYVNNRDENIFKNPVLIVSYNKHEERFKFKTDSGASFSEATPLTNEELYRFFEMY